MVCPPHPGAAGMGGGKALHAHGEPLLPAVQPPAAPAQLRLALMTTVTAYQVHIGLQRASASWQATECPGNLRGEQGYREMTRLDQQAAMRDEQ